MLVKILLCLVVIISMITDIMYNKIYNWLTIPIIIFTPFIHYYINGMDGVIVCIISGILALIVFIACYYFKVLGAGDVKLIIALSMLCGFLTTLVSLFWGSFVCMFYAIFLWLKTKNKKENIPFGFFIGLGYVINTVIAIL